LNHTVKNVNPPEQCKWSISLRSPGTADRWSALGL